MKSSVDLQFADKLVIGTGGSSGIGYAIANAFATERCRAVIAARRSDAVEDHAVAITGESTAVDGGITRGVYL